MPIQLLIFINRLAQKNKKTIFSHPDPTHATISKIVNYINNNFGQELKLDKVAEKYNLNPSYLSKIFKEITGFNFVEYKNNVRAKEARKLLQQTELNVTEIAGKVGYNNITHFGRTFKKITGYSPLNYRNLYKN
jgi:YesN/AraC family two-component response regulator